MIKSILIFTIAIIPGVIHAQEEVPVVTVVETNGSDTLYAKSELSRIVVNNKDFVELVFENGDTLRLDKKAIDRILLQGMGIPSSSGVKSPLGPSIGIFPNMTDDIIEVTGTEEPITYRVFALDGTMRHSGKVSPHSSSISIGHLPSGIYLLTIGRHTFKVTRK